MNQSIVGNNSAYSAADLENKTVVITGNNLLNETEITKDRGSEKHHNKEFDDNINKTNEFMDILPDNYQTETVDFPDSPKYRKFSEYSQSSQDQINEKEMEKVSRDFLTSESEQIPKQSKLRHIPFSTDGQTMHDSFSSDREEYFEDDLVTGKLDTAFSISDEDLSTEDDDFNIDQLNIITKHELNIRNCDNSLNSSEDMFVPDLSTNSDNESENLFSQNTTNCKTPNKLKSDEGFLFDEKSSEDIPDTALVNKVKSCFDMDKIKDIYMLSGRLQDILSPMEIEEIVTRSEIYSEFIDDDIIEILRQEKMNNFGSLDYAKNSLLETKKKKIVASRKELNMDVIDDIRIRAVFEDQRKSGKDIIDKSESMKVKHALKKDLPVSASGDIRAFFEESLVKSSSTLKKILPNNDELSISASLNENLFFGLPKQTLVLNAKNLETDAYNKLAYQQNSTPVLNPDGSIEIKTIKSKTEVNNRSDQKNNISFDIRNNTVNSEISNNQNGSVIGEKSRIIKDEILEQTMQMQDCSINLNSSGNLRKKKISVNRDILASDEHDDDDQKSFSSLSNKSDADVFSPIDDLITPDDIETPEELNESVFECAGSSLSEPIPEFSAAEELEEERSWKTCIVGGVKRNIDMKVIEPYKKVLSHGGYFGSTRNAIIVFSACYLPDRSRRDYDYVMDNLFLYVLVTLDQLVAEDYVLIYLHGATQRSNMPSFGWLKRCYQMIDRRLRKNLKGLYLVHPTFWLKTIVIMTRPFVSTKFSRKLQFVSTLQELSDLIPMDHVCIPDKVKQIEFQCIIKRKKKSMKNRSKQQYLTQ